MISPSYCAWHTTGLARFACGDKQLGLAILAASVIMIIFFYTKKHWRKDKW